MAKARFFQVRAQRARRRLAPLEGLRLRADAQSPDRHARGGSSNARQLAARGTDTRRECAGTPREGGIVDHRTTASRCRHRGLIRSCGIKATADSGVPEAQRGPGALLLRQRQVASPVRLAATRLSPVSPSSKYPFSRRKTSARRLRMSSWLAHMCPTASTSPAGRVRRDPDTCRTSDPTVAAQAPDGPLPRHGHHRQVQLPRLAPNT